jgi:sulfite exporter TauE/SafE
MNIAASLFLLGLSFGAGPCMVSCGPVLVSYFAAAGARPFENLKGYLVFCLGRMAAYALLSQAIFFIGKLATQTFLESVSRYIYLAGGIFVCALGAMFVVGWHAESRVCAFLQRYHAARGKNNLFVLGLIIGMVPCGPLIVLLASSALLAGNWGMSLAYCFIFGLGSTLSPLLLISLFAGGVSSYLKARSAFWQRLLNYLCGAIMIFLGIQLLFKGRG